MNRRTDRAAAARTEERTKLAVDLISDVIRRLQRRASINQDPHLLDWIGNLEDARNLLKGVGE